MNLQELRARWMSAYIDKPYFYLPYGIYGRGKGKKKYTYYLRVDTNSNWYNAIGNYYNQEYMRLNLQNNSDKDTALLIAENVTGARSKVVVYDTSDIPLCTVEYARSDANYTYYTSKSVQFLQPSISGQQGCITNNFLLFYHRIYPPINRWYTRAELALSNNQPIINRHTPSVLFSIARTLDGETFEIAKSAKRVFTDKTIGLYDVYKSTDYYADCYDVVWYDFDSGEIRHGNVRFGQWKQYPERYYNRYYPPYNNMYDFIADKIINNEVEYAVEDTLTIDDIK